MMWWGLGRRSLGALTLLFGLIVGYARQPAEAQVTFTQITNSTGDNSGWLSLSADGARIAFDSTRDLVPGGNSDSNKEIFLWTRGSGIIQLTSTTGGWGSDFPSISAGGTRIAFRSDRNLTGGNPDGNYEIFLWTQGSGFTQLTKSTRDNDFRPYTYAPSISADGTRITFGSDLDLVPGGNPDRKEEIFLWTQGSGLTQLTNTTTDNFGWRSISADGTRIAFSSVGNLVPGGNPDGNGEIFLWTQGSGFTQITNSTGGNNSTFSINADGTRIAFVSSSNLIPGGNSDGNYEIFLWTQGSGFTQITNSTANDYGWPSISTAGTRIAFFSYANLTGGNPDGNGEIFLWTQGAGLTQITNTTGGGNSLPSISADGTRIAFQSDRNLTGGNPDGNAEIFLATVGGTPPPPSPPSPSFGNPTTVPKNKLCDYGSKTCADKGKYHTGIDYSGNGTAVAVARGTVVRIERMSSFDHGMGNNVIVSHVLPDGSTIFSTYSHLASIDPGITENRPVDKGQILGIIGCSGFDDQYYWCRRGKIRNYHSPHLHFEMKTAHSPTSAIASTVTGNPKGVGKQYSTCKEDAKNAAPNTCWGYVGDTLAPDQYGYIDPNRYLPR